MSGKTALQVVVGLLAATPVLVGVEGIVSGPEFLHVAAPWPVDLDSHFRFLSGFFLAIGLAWYSCIPSIETKAERFRLLAACTFAGGLARLVSLLLVGAPSLGHVAGLFVELMAVPALVWWQRHVVNKASGTGQLSGA
ncbi:membrane protein [Mesorhizobium sp. LNHC220B00]|nr:membrane protein [Mesorhizobium sp. LNHC220B00]